MQVSPTSGLGALDFTNVVGFTPRAGTVGKLEALADNSLSILNAGALDELVEFGHPQYLQSATLPIHVSRWNRVCGSSNEWRAEHQRD